ncbi:MAG: DUF169 domain-containing protein [Nitrososphaerota archaeon]|nr:DUF169 domain-containing protein [Candidatus Calditenuis fumarioli]
MDRAEASVLIQHLLRCRRPPVAIRFISEGEEFPELPRSNEWVPSSCAFWNLAAQRSFLTSPEQHVNCSIGAVTHGVRGHEEVMPGCGCADVDALIAMGRIRPEDLTSLPSVRRRPSSIAYGPLEDFPVEPDVVLIVTEARGAQMVFEAARRAGLPVEVQGMPTCAGIPIALNNGSVVIGLGCSTSRLRASYGDHELVVFVPGRALERLVSSLEDVVIADRALVEAELGNRNPGVR